MPQDQTPRPPMPGRTKVSAAEKLGVPPERIVKVTLNPWAWAAARGLKPLPGREIPPEYRHLFEDQAGAAPETQEPLPQAPLPSRPR